jgi:hypothetical protein
VNSHGSDCGHAVHAIRGDPSKVSSILHHLKAFRYRKTLDELHGRRRTLVEVGIEALERVGVLPRLRLFGVGEPDHDDVHDGPHRPLTSPATPPRPLDDAGRAAASAPLALGYSRLPNRLEYSAPQSTPEQSSAACRMSIGDKPSSLCVNSASATAAAPATTSKDFGHHHQNIASPEIAANTPSRL